MDYILLLPQQFFHGLTEITQDLWYASIFAASRSICIFLQTVLVSSNTVTLDGSEGTNAAEAPFASVSPLNWTVLSCILHTYTTAPNLRVSGFHLATQGLASLQTFRQVQSLEPTYASRRLMRGSPSAMLGVSPQYRTGSCEQSAATEKKWTSHAIANCWPVVEMKFLTSIESKDRHVIDVDVVLIYLMHSHRMIYDIDWYCIYSLIFYIQYRDLREIVVCVYAAILPPLP